MGWVGFSLLPLVEQGGSQGCLRPGYFRDWSPAREPRVFALRAGFGVGVDVRYCVVVVFGVLRCVDVRLSALSTRNSKKKKD